MSPRIWMTAGAVALAAGLAGCGKVGQLERPGPLFGAGRNTTRQADDEQKKVQDPNRPVDTVDPRDRAIEPAPPRTLPIPGTGPSATDTPPRTAFPDPYAQPR
ncbi:MAG: hypothetical protein JF588_15250 [Caulobacterales bacterium]|nr:hypothetical protein [Caulobacterales bacterium]